MKRWILLLFSFAVLTGCTEETPPKAVVETKAEALPNEQHSLQSKTEQPIPIQKQETKSSLEKTNSKTNQAKAVEGKQAPPEKLEDKAPSEIQKLEQVVDEGEQLGENLDHLDALEKEVTETFDQIDEMEKNLQELDDLSQELDELEQLEQELNELENLIEGE